MKRLPFAFAIVAASVVFVSQTAGAVSPLASPLQSPLDTPRLRRHNAPPRMVVIGNSIAVHPPRPDIGWTGSWGMAASAPEHDFAHILADRAGASLETDSITALEWRYREFDLWMPQALKYSDGVDYLVLKLGDNVSGGNLLSFESGLGVFIDAIPVRRKLVCIGTYYPRPFDVDAIIRRVCESRGGVFVSVVDLSEDPYNAALSERTYAFYVVGIHPGDRGMRAIADRAWRAAFGYRAYFPWMPN